MHHGESQTGGKDDKGKQGKKEKAGCMTQGEVEMGLYVLYFPPHRKLPCPPQL